MSKKPTFEDYSKTSKKPAYSDDSFWKKIPAAAKSAGREVLRPALRLYFTQEAEKTPPGAKAIVYSALAYFIWPYDFVPDVIPGIGYTDDIPLMTAGLANIATHVTPAVKRKATLKLNQWFG